jgi:hypothetical protein
VGAEGHLNPMVSMEWSFHGAPLKWSQSG